MIEHMKIKIYVAAARGGRGAHAVKSTLALITGGYESFQTRTYKLTTLTADERFPLDRYLFIESDYRGIRNHRVHPK